jgi:hypothetical protein
MRLIKSLLFIAASCMAFAASAGQTQLTWYGHSAFKLTTPSGKILLIEQER